MSENSASDLLKSMSYVISQSLRPHLSHAAVVEKYKRGLAAAKALVEELDREHSSADMRKRAKELVNLFTDALGIVEKIKKEYDNSLKNLALSAGKELSRAIDDFGVEYKHDVNKRLTARIRRVARVLSARQ